MAETRKEAYGDVGQHPLGRRVCSKNRSARAADHPFYLTQGTLFARFQHSRIRRLVTSRDLKKKHGQCMYWTLGSSFPSSLTPNFINAEPISGAVQEKSSRRGNSSRLESPKVFGTTDEHLRFGGGACVDPQTPGASQDDMSGGPHRISVERSENTTSHHRTNGIHVTNSDRCSSKVLTISTPLICAGVGPRRYILWRCDRSRLSEQAGSRSVPRSPRMEKSRVPSAPYARGSPGTIRIGGCAKPKTLDRLWPARKAPSRRAS